LSVKIGCIAFHALKHFLFVYFFKARRYAIEHRQAFLAWSKLPVIKNPAEAGFFLPFKVAFCFTARIINRNELDL
jgi:hypothetical protein